MGEFCSPELETKELYSEHPRFKVTGAHIMYTIDISGAIEGPKSIAHEYKCPTEMIPFPLAVIPI